METVSEVQQLINSSKNIYIVPGQGHEAVASALALFYTLKEAGKQANLVTEKLPERLAFLAPSLDFISYPKNFVVAVPNSVAEVSQIYYEKTSEGIKVHFTIERGNIKKDNLSCYFTEAKPDAVVTIGVQDYQQQLADKLDSYGFLLESPVVNIDNQANNKKFGKINLVEDKPLSRHVVQLSQAPSKQAATCMLASLVLYTENFQNHVDAEVFEAAGRLMREGADLKEITRNLYPEETFSNGQAIQTA